MSQAGRLETSRLAISSKRKISSVLAGFVLATFALASCASVEPTPTVAIAPTAQVPTPTPTSTATSFVSDIELRDLTCVDFHPGIPQPDGPNHWYEVSGSVFNNSTLFTLVIASYEILDSNGSTRFRLLDKEIEVESGQPTAFFERLDLEAQANDFSCRVSFSVPDDGPDAVESLVAPVESIYAP